MPGDWPKRGRRMKRAGLVSGSRPKKPKRHLDLACKSRRLKRQPACRPMFRSDGRTDAPYLLQTNGRPSKYLTPCGGGVRVYFPPGTHEKLGGNAAEILITEGEKKSLAASQASYCCLGLPGVDCWHSKKSTSLLPDLEAIEWN